MSTTTLRSSATADAGLTVVATPTANDEATLVARVQGGNHDAYEVLTRRYLQRAFATAYRLMQHREDAEDLVQDAFLRALMQIDRVEAGRPFGPWFFRLLVNLGINSQRSRRVRRTEALFPETGMAADTPASDFDRAELRRQIAVALDALSDRQRMIVELDAHGFTSLELADALGMPAGTVRWHLHQARRLLADRLSTTQAERIA
jgi:RNA polymerase sigma-70 factor, ECF subfamily